MLLTLPKTARYIACPLFLERPAIAGYISHEMPWLSVEQSLTEPPISIPMS